MKISSKFNNNPVNLGNTSEMTILQFAQVIKELSGTAAEIVFVTPTDERTKDDPLTRRPDISKAQRQLKWEPKVALEDGLRATIDYFRTVLAEGNK
jgi:nucleoside-diphosphate-sugar epimerase